MSSRLRRLVDQADEQAGRSDFNSDGFADLAVGTGAGVESVSVLYGSAAGLTSAGNQLWSQDSPGIEGVTRAHDYFGAALAVGDFNGGGFGDLAIGVPWEQEGSGGGAVNVIYGSALGLTAAGNQLWSQDSPGVTGAAEADDGFGGSLAAANLGHSSHDDLVVGVPSEDVDRVLDAGAVQVPMARPTA